MISKIEAGGKKVKSEKLLIPFNDSFLSAMLFFPESSQALFPVVCKAHGLVSNTFEKEQAFAELLTKEGIAYLTFHFTGFYNSPGETSIQTSLENLEAVINYISHHPKIDSRYIGLYGVSLGAAIALCYAARDKRISAVALQAPVFDFSFVASYPEFDYLWDGLRATGLVRLPSEGVKETLLKDMQINKPMTCASKIAPRPLLIIACAEDKLIPLEGIQKLFRLAIDPKQFQVIQQADHNLTNSQARIQTLSVVSNFFRKQKELQIWT
jgi:pimeloyl-ACP methyl ester carboxylesterase